MADPFTFPPAQREAAAQWKRPPRSSPAQDLLQNLRAGARLALFRPVAAADFRASQDQVVLLVLLNAGLALAIGWLVTEEPTNFNIEAISAHGLWLVATFLLAYLSSRLSSQSRPFLPTMVILLCPLFVGWLAYGVIHGLCHLFGDIEEWRRSDMLRYAFLAWLFPVGVRSLRLGCDLSPLRCGALVGLHVALLWLVIHEIAYPFFFWTDDWASEEWSEEQLLNAEGLLHTQHRWLGDATALLRGGRPGVTDLYFLGFGADASQDVFMREVRFVRDLFDRRFDTRQRSLALINNVATLDERLPLASASNLADALLAIGRQMDEEDVLLLFLTGHGALDQGMAVNLRNLPLNDVYPENLAGMLAAAGIPWRVVIVSACYSGGFIDALASPRSLVMTAAAADRESFGCSEGADFTYFGRAYFAEQLTRGLDFVAAFEGARERIHEWESEEAKMPSLPQIASAPPILAKLSELRARLETLRDSRRIVRAGEATE